MKSATAQGTNSPRALTRYRTGLQIAFLALRPLRIRDFARLRVTSGSDDLDEDEMSIFAIGRTYWVTGRSSKTNARVNFQYPMELASHLDDYLQVWRPAICRNQYDGDYLWVSTRGCAQGVNSIYKQIVKRTQVDGKKGINPHLFRDYLATTVARADPEAWDSVHRILGNSPEILDKYYDHTTTIDAGTRITKVLASLLDEE
jgi:integrase